MENFKRQEYKKPLLLGENVLMNFIKFIYGRTDKLDPYWNNNYDDFLSILLEKGILFKNGRGYEISASFGSPKKCMMTMKKIFNRFKNRNKLKFKVIAKNEEVKILVNGDGVLYVLYIDDNDILKIDDDLKKRLLDLYDKNQKIVNALGGNNEELTNEVTTAASSGQYTASAFPNIRRDGSFKEAEMTRAQKETQYSGGGFVKFKDCVRPNNKPCSQGAIDKPVKVVSTRANVISPSLNEGLVREALKLKKDDKTKKLIVISDLEGKAASQETFSNKNVLKQNGFVWNGSNWVINYDQLDNAKRVLTLINKADYLVNTLEDIEDFIETAENVDGKNLIKAKLDQYIKDLADATDEAALSAEIRRYLTFFSKFHDYSFYNRILIYIQRPDATKVASYKKWQEKFRQVKKGAKGIMIFAPIISKTKKDSDKEDDDFDLKPDTVTRFRAVSVFDISDTEPIDERGEVPETPQWWGENTPSETADKLYGYVSEVASDMGIKVTQSDASRGEKGYAAGDHINISSDVEGVGKLSTMIHEIAHELMHFKKSSIFYQDDEVRSSSALKELQAESVSYVVLKHYGIPVKHHTTYLALWGANKEKIQSNLEVISKVSQFIIDRIDEEEKRDIENKK